MRESKRKKTTKAALIILVIEVCNAFRNDICRIKTTKLFLSCENF